jgi:O-6-methylguanine DNA methyltransferase
MAQIGKTHGISRRHRPCPQRAAAAAPQRPAARKIPVSATVSDTDIAKCIGLPKSLRAVARACGTNALAVAIPCHRVVRHESAWSGYR